MKLRERAEEIAAIPQRINMMVALSFACLLIATAALVVAATKGK